MAKWEARVPDVSCQHCVNRVTKGLKELSGVQDVKVDVQTKAVVVEYGAPASETSIRDKLAEIGYPADEPVNRAQR
jgi:copper chaperone